MKNPILITGPCSAETEAQVIGTARRLDSSRVDYFRAGIWKPRTSPGAFEGIGEEGLRWLKRVKQETGMKTCTEVASPKHVEGCLEAGIDMVWLGARTTTSPFVVQEIAESLKGVEIPVGVKNPMNPDLKLWLGAIERLKTQGVRDILAVHRGFNLYKPVEFRNHPMWQIAVDFKSMAPDVPLLCDPSHICGSRKCIAEISQKAMDMQYEGLMIECHWDPEHAWTDAAQQITPETLHALLDGLVVRESLNGGADNSDLEHLRDEINMLDDELMSVMERRMEVSRKIGSFKRAHDMTILQRHRWEQVLKRNVDRAARYDVTSQFVSDMFKLIHQESISIQEKIMRGEGDQKD